MERPSSPPWAKLRPDRTDSSWRMSSVSVVIPCYNYGHFLETRLPASWIISKASTSEFSSSTMPRLMAAPRSRGRSPLVTLGWR